MSSPRGVASSCNSHSVSYASRVKSIDDGGMLVTSLVASPPLYIINVLLDGFAIFTIGDILKITEGINLMIFIFRVGG